MASLKENQIFSSEVVPPSVASGFARMRIPIFASLFALALFYNVLFFLVKDSTQWLRPADEYCKGETSANDIDGTTRCSRPDLFAFQAASAVSQLLLGGFGFYTWHVSRKVITDIPQTPEGRLFGFLKEAELLNAGIFVYQTFDFFASLLGPPEHATVVYLTHHLLAAATAFMSLEFQMVHYYAVFFGGCSEISTIFLVLCDFDVYFPAERGSSWFITITICQVSFTFTFLYYRIIGWYKVSRQLWTDVFLVAKKGRIEEYRPGKAWFLYGFLIMDFLLGLLQVYWFAFGIVPKILEIL